MAGKAVGRRAESAAIKEPPHPDHALGKRIRMLRKEILGFVRQADFAERLGVTRGAVGNWEIGVGMKRANLERMAKEFNVSLTWLTTGTGAPVAQPGIDARLDLLPPEERDPLYEHFQAMIDNRLRAIERKQAATTPKRKKKS